MKHYTQEQLAVLPAEELIDIIIEIQQENDDLIEENDYISAKLSGAEDELREAEKENSELEAQLVDSFTDATSVNLGLDTLHYKLERGNLQIASRLEQFLQGELNTVPHAEIFK